MWCNPVPFSLARLAAGGAPAFRYKGGDMRRIPVPLSLTRLTAGETPAFRYKSGNVRRIPVPLSLTRLAAGGAPAFRYKSGNVWCNPVPFSLARLAAGGAPAFRYKGGDMRRIPVPLSLTRLAAGEAPAFKYKGGDMRRIPASLSLTRREAGGAPAFGYKNGNAWRIPASLSLTRLAAGETPAFKYKGGDAHSVLTQPTTYDRPSSFAKLVAKENNTPFSKSNTPQAQERRTEPQKKTPIPIETPPPAPSPPLLRKGGVPTKSGRGDRRGDFKHIAKQHNFIYNGRHLPYHPALIRKARELRKNMTKAEKKIWYDLFRKFPHRVLRQRPIDYFIADFYIPALRLVVEIDGEYHNTPEIQERDAARTERLEVYGIKVIRFTNHQVLNNFIQVRRAIRQELERSL